MPCPAERGMLLWAHDAAQRYHGGIERASKGEGMSISKIVVTGGPCGGKTTALSRIQRDLTHLGYTVLIVPEHDIIITFSLRENPTVRDFTERYIFHMDTHQRTRLLLGIFLRVAQRYLVYLRNINRQFIKNEKALQKSLANEDLIKMLGLEKSLVYFSTSLKADEATLVRINSGRSLKLYEDDKDLLEDVFIEIRQAIEMCTIYSNILNGTMDTYGNVIANNMNIVMRTLTVVAIVLALPTIVFSFYGMNVEQLPLIMSPIFPLVLSIVAVALAILAMQRMKPFK